MNDLYLESIVIEHINNGDNPIDWVHWFSMRFWKPKEACFLLYLKNPNTFDKVVINYEKHKRESPETPYSELIDDIFKLIDRAEREQFEDETFKNVSPRDWIKWAVKNKLTIPTQFDEIFYKPQIESAQTNTDFEDTRKKWEIPGRLEFKCRELGKKFITAKINLGQRQPSVDEIAKHIEQKLKEENLTGKRGDYWNWQTIKREALPGITGKKSKGKR